MARADRGTVVFDLGGVLIDWDPRHLYRKLFAGKEAAIEHFLATICTHEWNRGQDAGRSFAEGCHLLKTHYIGNALLDDPVHLQGRVRRHHALRDEAGKLRRRGADRALSPTEFLRQALAHAGLRNEANAAADCAVSAE
jgi:hypothetical protein